MRFYKIVVFCETPGCGSEPRGVRVVNDHSKMMIVSKNDRQRSVQGSKLRSVLKEGDVSNSISSELCQPSPVSPIFTYLLPIESRKKVCASFWYHLFRILQLLLLTLLLLTFQQGYFCKSLFQIRDKKNSCNSIFLLAYATHVPCVEGVQVITLSALKDNTCLSHKLLSHK